MPVSEFKPDSSIVGLFLDPRSHFDSKSLFDEPECYEHKQPEWFGEVRTVEVLGAMEGEKLDYMGGYLFGICGRQSLVHRSFRYSTYNHAMKKSFGRQSPLLGLALPPRFTASLSPL